MLLHALAHRRRRGAVGFSSSGGTSGGGSGGGLPSRFSRIHLPRITGDVRFGVRRDQQQAALAEQAAARIARHRHAAEVRCRRRSGCRSAWRAARSRTCSPRQQVEHAAVLAHDALEQHLRLALERLAQVVVEVGEHRDVGIRVLQLAQDTATGPRSW